MRIVGVLVIACMSVSVALSQPDPSKRLWADSTGITITQFTRYMDRSLERGTGVLWSVILPGGGFFYAREGWKGILYFGAETGLGVWLVDGVRRESSDAWIAAFLWLFVKVYEITGVVDAVNKHNRALREMIGIASQCTFENSRVLSVSFALR